MRETSITLHVITIYMGLVSQPNIYIALILTMVVKLCIEIDFEICEYGCGMGGCIWT